MGYKFNPFTGNLDLSGDVANGVVSSSGSSTDNSIARFDGTTGLVIQNSLATISDAGVLTAEGVIDNSLTASRALATNGSKQLVSSAVTSTELGYVSGVTSAIQTQLNAKENTANKGVAGGYASLDGGGKVPVTQLPNSIMEFQGVWDASTNTPTLADGVGNIGDVYRVNVAGTQDLGSGSQTFVVGDWVILDASLIWRLAHAGADAVVSVNGAAGVVTVNAINQLTGDVTAGPASGSASATATVVSVGGATSTELGYMAGVTSAVQTQLDGMLKLAGRVGGQLAYGGTAASNDLTLRSTSNATKGKVILGDQTGETSRLGPTGSTTTYINTHHILVPSGDAVTNSLTIQENSANHSNTSGVAGAAGFTFNPHNAAGSAEIRVRGQSSQSYLHHNNYIDGSYQGYLSLGTWGVMNGGTGEVPFKISGTTGQTVDLCRFSNVSDFLGTVSSIGSDGQFRAPAGTVSLPGHSIHGDSNTGSFGPAADTLAWALGGVEKLRLSSDGLTVGVAGATTGQLNLTGSTSGTITIQGQAAAGTFNFNLPTTAGSSGQVLASGGGGASPMTWASVGLASAGDINETSFTAADNQAVAANVTGLAFANGTVRSFEAIVSIVRASTYQQYKLLGIQRAADWVMSQSSIGDDAGLVFSITTAGQVQYTSTSTGSTAALKFRAVTTSV